MKKTLLFLVCVGVLSTLMGQREEASSFTIVPTFGGEAVSLEQAYAFAGDSVSFSKLRFYISAVSLWQEGKEVWAEKKSYHLIDLAEPASMNLALKKGLAFDEVRFQLGIDSITNVSGAMGGDLDPTKGMYWSWNTGYINFKLEGKSALAGIPNHDFIYHLGGYLPPYPSVQWVKLPCSPAKEQLIQFDLSSFLQAADIGNQPRLMSPGEPAAKLSAIAASLFKMIDDE
ncbi:MAG: MbnP family protein [Bacteroidia bacterium]